MRLYKGFNKDLRCRGYQFAIGETYKHEGGVKLCERGFHASALLSGAFKFYPKSESRFCEVELSGDVVEGPDKCVGSIITIVRELSAEDIAREEHRQPLEVTKESLIAEMAEYFWNEMGWEYCRAEFLYSKDKERKRASENNAQMIARFMRACAENYPELAHLLKVKS